MDCVKSNNDIILFAKPNKIIGRKIIGTTECGRWNICFNEDPGTQTSIPSDPDYFNKYYHETTSI